MNEQRYAMLSRPFRKHPTLFRILLLLNKLCTLAGYISYPLLIVILLYRGDHRGIPYVLIPGISFVLLSLFRDRVNKPRPYEILAINPLIKKDTLGHSFPSRHTFSIFLIATCWLGICPYVGFVLLVIAFLLACIRVIGGVHFPMDVFCGAVIGFVCGILPWIIS
ncbi:MAG: phosphatase PAP2 family protein [Eubacteriales bacterium]|nr:phosphatase PAP2 family protein [Eubacteriales bacterium]